MQNLVDIILPEGQLEGTSATLSVWLVKEGDKVKAGDPIAELETDKVVMEICALARGQIQSLAANPGDEVVTEQVLGYIDTAAEDSTAGVADDSNAPTGADTATGTDTSTRDSSIASKDDQSASHLMGPAVRRLLRENALSLAVIPASGKHGRVTRDDVLAYIQNAAQQTTTTSVQTPETTTAKSSVTPLPQTNNLNSLASTHVPHSPMRKSIASHMVDSLLHTSPHVTSLFEMDMGNIIEHRKWHKKEFEEFDVKLTFSAYFLAAMVKAVQAVPQTNARFHEDALEIFDNINVGVGTALGDDGLVVPVIEQVQEMKLFDIAQSLNKQTLKARDGKLNAADMRNGTITLSNHGVSGSLFATPIIIKQPQVAILGIGKLQKRVVVEEVDAIDTLIIKPMCYVSLSIDHRALDAHQSNHFLSVFVETIENWGQ